MREKFEAEHQHWHDWYGKDQTYDAAGLQWRQASGLRLMQAHVPAGGRVLDAGCGAGHAAVALAGFGFDVVGLDIAPSMIELAERNATEAGVAARCRFVAADLEAAVDTLGTFDGILALGFLEYFEDPIALLVLLRRLLKPGGVLVVQAWNKRPHVARLVDLLASVRHLSRPRRALGLVAHAILPGWLVAKLGGGPTPPSYDDVSHRRYSARDVRRLAARAGLVPTDETGSRYCSRKAGLPDRWKFRLERKLQAWTRKSPRLARAAVDYVAALRRPEAASVAEGDRR